MAGQMLLYLGACLPFFWGIAHLFPTGSVVRGFGDISLDNQRIIRMEWIIGGVSLIFMGVLVAAVTYIGPTTVNSRTVYWICFVTLNTLSLVSLRTGFKIEFLPYKLCPVVWLRQGEIKPIIAASFPLVEATRAHEVLLDRGP